MNWTPLENARLARRTSPIALLVIVIASMFFSALLGFACSVIEIWFDLAAYGPDHDSLLAAMRIETDYIVHMTFSVAMVGSVAGVLGAVILFAWRSLRSRTINEI